MLFPLACIECIYVNEITQKTAINKPIDKRVLPGL